MAYIPKVLRQQVIERARGLCEYCQTSQLIVIALQIDHILPIALAGQTTLDNLCLACEFCNGYKNDQIQALDPKKQYHATIIQARVIWILTGLHPPK